MPTQAWAWHPAWKSTSDYVRSGDWYWDASELAASIVLPGPREGDPFANHYYRGDGLPFDINTQAPGTIKVLRELMRPSELRLQDKAAKIIAKFPTPQKGGPAIGTAFGEDLKTDFTPYVFRDVYYLGNTTIKATVQVTKRVTDTNRVETTIRIRYDINDDFVDEVDAANLDGGPHRELPGGSGYPITGSWKSLLKF